MTWPCLNVQCSVTRRALVNAVVLDRRSWEKGSQFAAIPGFPDASKDTLTLATGPRPSWLGPRELLCEILVTAPKLCCPYQMNYIPNAALSVSYPRFSMDTGMRPKAKY